jgi:hypothetical protein
MTFPLWSFLFLYIVKSKSLPLQLLKRTAEHLMKVGCVANAGFLCGFSDGKPCRNFNANVT